MAFKSASKILVVDDDAASRFFLSEVLIMAGYGVDNAEDGMAALEFLKRADYDLVITDINMPRLNGMDFYSAAAVLYPRLKDSFIFMTADLTMGVWSAISKFGGECLLKPFKITELLARLDKIMLRSFENHGGGDGGKRVEKRFTLDAACEIFEKDSNGRKALSGRILDVSGSGLKIAYAWPPLTPGLQISVYAGINSMNLLRGANVAWSKGAGPGESISGLSLSRPVPVSSMIRSTGAKEGLKMAV